MIKALYFVLFSLIVTFGAAQESGGRMSGGEMSGGQMSGDSTEVGDVVDNGLILITTRSPSSYVATADGAALYTLVDDNGEVLPCEDACLQSWPSYTGAAQADAGTGLDPSLVGTVESADGQQVTYNDYPLYTFTGDQQPVDVTGQAVEGFGGTWYVIGEDGMPFIEEPTTTE